MPNLGRIPFDAVLRLPPTVSFTLERLFVDPDERIVMVLVLDQGNAAFPTPSTGTIRFYVYVADAVRFYYPH